MSVRTIQVDNSITGDDCPVNSFWRNVDLTVSVAAVVVDSVVWGQYLEYLAYVVGSDPPEYELVADTFYTPSQRNNSNIIPCIIVRNLDANGDSIWTISVPTDDDGMYIFGSNRGDYMADVWEEEYILPGKSVVDFMPFAQWSTRDPYPPTDHPSADQDYILQGRTFQGHQLYGDRLCNFSEYRGFWVCGDQNKLYSTGKHCRTDPNRKTVFLHIASQIPDSLHKYFPGHISEISDSLEVFFTDSVGYYQPFRRTDRNSRKYVTRNTIGAARFYYGYPNLTIFPFVFTATGYPEYQQAVAFWQYDAIQIRNQRVLQGQDELGNTYGYYWIDSISDTVHYTEGVSQIVLNYGAIDSQFVGKQFYETHPDSIAPHREWLIEEIIAHEFGHAVGMQHVQQLSIMEDSLHWDWTQDGNKLKTFDPFFGDSSFSQTAIRCPYIFR